MIPLEKHGMYMVNKIPLEQHQMNMELTCYSRHEPRWYLHGPCLKYHVPTYSVWRLLRNNHTFQLTILGITQSHQDQIKLGMHNTVVINTWPQGAWSLPGITTRHQNVNQPWYPWYHFDALMITQSNQLLSSLNQGYLLVRLSLLLPHSVTYYEHGPYPRARLSIDYTHCVVVSTLYPHHEPQGLILQFGWTSSVPTKPIYCMTLSSPLRPTPLWAKSWVAPDVLWTSNGHRCGKTKTVLNRDKGAYNNYNHTRLSPPTGPG